MGMVIGVKKSLKILVVLLGVLLLCERSSAVSQAVYLVFDHPDQQAVITKRYRSLDHLRASGSGQFSADELPNILRAIPADKKNIWIVDLRQESHGFIDGLPVAWVSDKNAANVGKSAKQIQHDEIKLLREIAKQKTVTVYDLVKLDNGKVTTGKPTTLIPESVDTESQLVTSLGAQYKRIHVLDHNMPDAAAVDSFIDFVRSKATPDSWIHFHCRGGVGRASTFLAMYDMLQNGKHASFNQIMQRQVDMGNVKLNKISNSPEKQWKSAAAQERYEFLKEFYAYTQDSSGYGQRSWSAWLTMRNQ